MGERWLTIIKKTSFERKYIRKEMFQINWGSFFFYFLGGPIFFKLYCPPQVFQINRGRFFDPGSTLK